MAGFSLLALGAALGGGYLLGRKRKSSTPQGIQPPGATPAPERATATLAEKVESTKPPDPIKAASENMLGAQQTAARTRKRAAAGSAGRASTGPVSNAQKAIANTGSAKTLLGY
jgi:hypothetical protein